MTLRGFQRKALRGMAHGLDPVARLGKAGLTEDFVDGVSKALERHELVKVRIGEFKEERRELSRRIAEAVDAEEVGLIGNVVILYQQHPDPEKRRIRLPDSPASARRSPRKGEGE